MMRRLSKNQSNNNKPAKKTSLSPEDIRKLVEKKAYEVFCSRKNRPGDHLSDWLVAERQVKIELGIR